jgi:dihydropteroate synthase
MRVIEISDSRDLKLIMREINVDPYGIKIMLPKALMHLVRIDSLPCITANIIKQEMLSLGGDAAIARGALTGKIKKTDCLLIGNLSQFARLSKKLRKQPFNLDELSSGLSHVLGDYQKNSFTLNLGGKRLSFNCGKPRIMGIMNLTPDSFSGDGLLTTPYPISDAHKIIDCAQSLVKDGVDIIDIGGESTRPQARRVSEEEELKRTIPVIKLLAKRIKTPISIDTYKSKVAKQALDNGAVIVNDISGLRDPKMVKIVAEYKAAVIIMHMKGTPPTMQKNPVYNSVTGEIIEYLRKAADSAILNGVDKNKIIVDPGIGFGKTLRHNLEILKRLKEFKTLGFPVLVGPSRKSFIGALLNVGPRERLFGTISACVLAAANGASIVRVHDVKAVREALKVAEAVINN